VLFAFCRMPDGEQQVCSVSRTTEALDPATADSLMHGLLARLSGELGQPKSDDSAKASVWSMGSYTAALVRLDEGVVGIEMSTREGQAMVQEGMQEFPLRVAGLTLNASEPEVSRQCRASGGTYVGNTALASQGYQDIAPTFFCMEPKVDLPFSVGNVTGLFCENRLCEITLWVGSGLGTVRQAFDQKYGSPLRLTRAGNCREPAESWAWFWGTNGQSEGVLRIFHDCSVWVHYDTPEGWELRSRQRDAPQQDF